ncbi:MAG: pilus assembly protein PilM, partial [Planctomycetes bacterium]|nr:pilus assembly protein PilM [Planctomycetota bacterium]
MGAGRRGVWAIDIGTISLKALRLCRADEGYEVIGFDYIEHSMPLTMEGLGEEERDRIIGETLGKFSGRNEFGKDEVAISVAGHTSFARFIKLPPVETKRIPQIVQFEAVQQIPFDINEVEWDWQIMDNPDSPDTEVGIFAIKNELINATMDHFSHENMKVACVQIAPMALYNYAMYDRSDISDGGKPIVVLDMGAENTTLVVCTKHGVWQRSIRIGGNTFTEAIADAFKLRQAKAEKLKRTAPMSKYVRQIFTAMKPVFTDLGSEVQRSLGFYTGSGSSGKKGFSKIIALGGGMKLQGVTKYLQQTLGVPVIKPDTFEKLKVSEDVSSAKFHKNVSDFGVVYGLAVQLLGESTIETNLLPRRIARAMTWNRKGRYFTIAASILMAVAVLSYGNVQRARRAYDNNSSLRSQTSGVIMAAQKATRDLAAQKGRSEPIAARIQKRMDVFKNREMIPRLNELIISCLPNAGNNPDQAELYDAFASGDVSMVVSFPRDERKQLFLSRMSVKYAPSLVEAQFTMLPDSAGGAAGYSLGNVGASSYSAPGYDEDGEEAAPIPGFVVGIEGWSPYVSIDELMDPPGVGADRSRWGLVTRLENLSKVAPGCGLELYEKEDIRHFRLDTDEVEIGSPVMPAGIGVLKEIRRVGEEQWSTGTMPGGNVARPVSPVPGRYSGRA